MDLPPFDLASLPLDEALRSALVWLMRRHGARHAAWGWYERGHAEVALRVSAAPDASALQSKPGSGREPELQAALEEAIDQGVTLQSDDGAGAPTDWVVRAQNAWARHCGGPVATVPLPGAHQPHGAVCLGWGTHAPGQDDDTPAKPDTGAVERDVLALHATLVLLRRAERPWHWHLRLAARERWARWRAGLSIRRRQAWSASLAVLALLALIPLPDHVGGQARVEGAMQRVLAAPSDGFIKAAHALPGDKVRQGQVLADLAEQDLKLERDKWLSQVSQQDNAYAAAMTRADRAEAALSLSRLEEAQAQLALIDEQLQRAQLKAPFDGVLIQGDLSQAIGAPVKQGDALMTVASTARFRVVVDIDESDIARVRPGQPGRMALSALPWDSLAVRVERVTPLGQARDGRNVFEVQAAITEAVPSDVRPGLTGRARVEVGRSPVWWGAVRPLVERLRLLWWSL